MTAVNTSAWAMLRNALIVSSWQQRSSDFLQRSGSVIASAVRYNTTEFVYYGNYDDGPGLDKERYLLVAKLTAILRLANAMDRSHYQKVQGLKAVLKDRELQVMIDSSRIFHWSLDFLRIK